jgi:hypothetical protein
MTLDQAQQILKVVKQRREQARRLWRRAQTKPTKDDFINILADSNYITKLLSNLEYQITDYEFWNTHIKNKTFGSIPFEANIHGWSFQQYYGLDTNL